MTYLEAITKRELAKHMNAERRANRYAAILTGFAQNPRSAWYGLRIEVVEKRKTRRVPAPNGGRQDTRPTASRFEVWAGDGMHITSF